MSKYRDFDAFFSEVEQSSGLEIKLFDKTYFLPAEIPALILLNTLRMSREGIKIIPEEKQMELAFAMLGEKNVTEWCEKGLSMNKLGEIMKWAAKEANGEGGGFKKKRQVTKMK